MVICGLIAVSGHDIWNSFLGSIKDGLNSAFSGLGVAVDNSGASFTPFMLPIAYALIGVGVVVGSLALLGIIGGCCSIKIMLIVYVVTVSALFLAQLVLIAVVYVGKTSFGRTNIKVLLKKSLSSYSGIEGKNPKTLSWNAIMNYMECCGVDSFTDFHGLQKWPPVKVGGKNVTLETPIVCCKKKTTDYSCAEKETANDSNNWYNTGCYDKIYSTIVNSKYFIAVIGLFLAVHLGIIIVTTLLLCTKKSILL